MVAIIDEALGKRRSCGEPSTKAPNLKRACFVKKMGIDLWLLQMRALLLTNFYIFVLHLHQIKRLH